MWSGLLRVFPQYLLYGVHFVMRDLAFVEKDQRTRISSVIDLRT
jgi:hypothetical protein